MHHGARGAWRVQLGAGVHLALDHVGQAEDGVGAKLIDHGAVKRVRWLLTGGEKASMLESESEVKCLVRILRIAV